MFAGFIITGFSFGVYSSFDLIIGDVKRKMGLVLGIGIAVLL